MIHRLRTTPSTMIEAAALARRGAPHGTAVVAEEQTAGVGRHGHSWRSAPGAGIYLSIVLRLPGAPPILTLALGLAAQRGIDDFASVSCDIRWPNDILLSSKKLAGIMIQSAGAGDAFIAGIGVNVNQTEFPPDLRDIATSLRIETGREFEKEPLVDRLLAESLRCSNLTRARILRQFEEHSAWTRGKHVRVEGGIEGVTAGLDDEGFLLVSTANGVERILAGGVREL